MFISELLPDPLAPQTATDRPASNSTVMLRNARTETPAPGGV